MPYQILSQPFFQRDTTVVAQELLGKLLVRSLDEHIKLVGIITETESYKGLEDPASHAYRGLTIRSAPLFGPVGFSYVYFIYGNHYCLNIVARDTLAQAGGVLIRAIRPLEGINIMRSYRRCALDKHIADGPGKLTQALALTLRHNNLNLMKESSELCVAEHNIEINPAYVIATSRIGITQGKDFLWRFYYKGTL